MRIAIDGCGAEAETIYARINKAWIPALSATISPIRIVTPTGPERCVLTGAVKIKEDLVLTGDCSIGTFEQRLMFTAENDVVDVSTRLTLQKGASIYSVEDRYDFDPERHLTESNLVGPLDFVWSQNIKSEKDDLIPTFAFKSPAVMFQQGKVFAAILPKPDERQPEPLALDLDVTSEVRPWFSYGSIPSEPHGHSYFKRVQAGKPKIIANTIEYSYSILVSQQPEQLGYRRVVRQLWDQYGHATLLRSPEMQQNVIRRELSSFDSWRDEAWKTYADRIYISFDCGGQQCGTLASDRSASGDWKKREPDAWFNAWFQTLRTAYGWYLHARNTHDVEQMSKAESVLNLALSAPQKDGAFATIYLLKSQRWLNDDGWAGYQDDHHAFCMSWTAYWMLRWATDLVPERSPEILRFVRPYGDFLIQHQLSDGVIPSWYDTSGIPRAEFRDFNAETTASALFLATLGKTTGEQRYTAAAESAMNFITNEVVPRERWSDFETFLSCARKDYSFYDRWTAQFPQNNLAEIQAPEAWLTLYHTTHKREYLDRGLNALDYLLLTQQVWTNPAFSPNLLGGFTTQNTDAEWSDARESYAAIVLDDYYTETGDIDYLERSVAAARSGFAVAPWENWAHTGHLDEPGALTGFHWGTGSAMTSVEIMSRTLGDAFIDLRAKRGVGFDECSVHEVRISENRIAFRIESPARLRTFTVRFSGIDPSRRYIITWNNRPEQSVMGRDLQMHGFRAGPLL